MIRLTPRLPRLAGCLSLGVALAVFLASAAHAKKADKVVPRAGGASLNDQIRKEKKTLDQVKKEIETHKKKGLAAKKEETAALAEMARTQQHHQLRRDAAARIAAQVKRKAVEQAALSADLKQTDSDILKKEVALGRRVRAMYLEKRPGLLQNILSVRGEVDFKRKVHGLRAVARAERRALSRIQDTRTRLAVRNEAMVLQARHLAEEKVSMTRGLAALQTEERARNRHLTRVRLERDFYEKSVAHLDESALQLQIMIRDLEAKKQALQRPVAGKFAKEKGRLTWPNAGVVVARFGRQKHPRFDTYVQRKGIEISPPETRGGDAVRAVHDGVVAYADAFRGYGMVVILDHGENYYSVYGHMGRLRVSVGDRVGKSRPLGEVAGAGGGPDGNLYFEIRHQGAPQDPLAWLQERS